MSAHDSNLRAAALLASYPFAKDAKGWATPEPALLSRAARRFHLL